MWIEIDFESGEAFYVQLQNQIIMEIAMERLKEGDTLPSVRQLADAVGINMHTVNKAYSSLREEGFLRLDRRRGAVVAIDSDRAEYLDRLRQSLRILLARGYCKQIRREEIHRMVDEIFEEYGKGNR